MRYLLRCGEPFSTGQAGGVFHVRNGAGNMCEANQHLVCMVDIIMHPKAKDETTAPLFEPAKVVCVGA